MAKPPTLGGLGSGRNLPTDEPNEKGNRMLKFDNEKEQAWFDEHFIFVTVGEPRKSEAKSTSDSESER